MCGYVVFESRNSGIEVNIMICFVCLGILKNVEINMFKVMI